MSKKVNHLLHFKRKVSENKFEKRNEIDLKFDTKTKKGILKNAHRYGIEQISNPKLIKDESENGTLMYFFNTNSKPKGL
jgi:ABC-type oligopeptide transport system substrate-binding subunit